MTTRQIAVQFIELQIKRAAQTLKMREDMQSVWRGGTDASWRKVGCKASKAERVKASEMHGRIAKTNREELHLFKIVLEELS